MHIGILGYGKMGQVIEKLALERGHKIPLIIDKDNQHLFEEYGGQLDATIEFTTPKTAVTNIKQSIDKGIPIIVGTTGWLGQLEEIKDYVAGHNGTLFYTSNFSLGVNIFFKLNKWLADTMGKYTAYQVRLDEVHHVHKEDKPSGTALTLAETIIDKIARYDGWSLDTADKKNKLPLFSHRKDEVAGTHSVSYQSGIDELTIQHTAYDRTGFALGAIEVAEWIKGKKGVFTMDDFLNF